MFSPTTQTSRLLLPVLAKILFAHWAMLTSVSSLLLCLSSFLAMLVLVFADFTYSHALTTRFEVVKFFREKVSIFAMRLSGVLCGWAIAAQNVFFTGNEFEVLWITAASIFAKMVELRNVFAFSARERAVCFPSIENAMSRFAARFICYAPVPTGVYVPGPVPAPSLFVNRDMGHKTSGFNFGWFNNQIFIIHKLIVPQMNQERNLKLVEFLKNV